MRSSSDPRLNYLCANFVSFAAPTAPLDAYDAAQSLLPEIARPLQKYLRITRQQPRHSTDSVLAHLATCLR